MDDCISREAVIEAVCRRCHYEFPEAEPCGDCLVKTAIKAVPAADAKRARQRWIPVSDEIPQTNPTVFGVRYSNIVLVFTEDQKIMAAFLKKWPNGERHWYGPFEFWETDEIFVTHWMPLPEPPEGGSEKCK